MRALRSWLGLREPRSPPFYASKGAVRGLLEDCMAGRLRCCPMWCAVAAGIDVLLVVHAMWAFSTHPCCWWCSPQLLT
jgi:hypothetical protein